MKDTMVIVFVKDNTYAQYVALLQKLDNNKRACKKEKATTKMGSSTSPPIIQYAPPTTHTLPAA